METLNYILLDAFQDNWFDKKSPLVCTLKRYYYYISFHSLQQRIWRKDGFYFHYQDTLNSYYKFTLVVVMYCCLAVFCWPPSEESKKQHIPDYSEMLLDSESFLLLGVISNKAYFSVWWCTPVILAYQEAEAGWLKSSRPAYELTKWMRPSLKVKKILKGRGYRSVWRSWVSAPVTSKYLKIK